MATTKIEIGLHQVQADFIHSKALFRGFVGGRGAGKALDLDTPIPTPGGWSRMGDLKVGDAVFDENGHSCRVTAVTEVWHDRPCYRLTFSDGETLVADAEHEWLTSDRRARAQEPGCCPQVRTTLEIAATLLDGGEINHSIPTCDPLPLRRLRYITAVDRVESVPVRCIEVDSPSHLYLAGRGMIPTHNSFVGSYDLLRRAKPNRLYMVVAPTYKVLKDASYRSFCEHANKLRFIKKLNKSDLRITLGNGAEVLFRSAENPDSLRGPNISGCWMDEASYCEEEAFNIVMACLREAGEFGWLTCTFTPKGKQHWTYKRLGKNIEARRKNDEAVAAGNPPREVMDGNVELFTAGTRDNPFLPPEFAAVLATQYTSKMASQELEGKFLDLGGKMFNRAWFTQMLRQPPMQARWVRFWDKACLVGDTLVETLQGPVPIRHVRAGMMVLTRKGYRRVTWAGLTKYVTETVSVAFTNGSVVTGTGDHRVWTENRGWTPLDELAPADDAITLTQSDGQREPVATCPASAPGVLHLAGNGVPVYDLTVEGEHEFFANGILVHNSTENGGCHTCGVLMGADYQGKFYIADIIRGQWSTYQREEIMKMTAREDAHRFHHQVKIYVEQEPGSGGVDSLRSTIISLAGYPVYGDRPSKDKRVRAEPFAAQAEAGNVILIEPANGRNWINDFLDEMEAFPDGAADQVDATSGAFNKLTQGNASRPVTAGSGQGASGQIGQAAGTAGGVDPVAAAAAQGVYPGPGMPGMAGHSGGQRGGLQGLPGPQGGSGGLLGVARPGGAGGGLLGMPGRR